MTRMMELSPYRGSLVGRDIFDRFEKLFEDFGFPTLFEEKEGWLPAFDIIEKEKEYIVTAEIPGIDPNDIEITISNGILTIKGEKKREEEDKGENYYYMERRYGSFQRSFRLPNEIQSDKVDATYKNGVLKLVLPKAHATDVKKIEVKQ